MKTEITGIILAGGKSSRMGTDKGLLLLNGKSMVEIIADTLKSIISQIIIISNGNNYDNLGYKVYADIIKNCGPMGGVYTGLSYSNTEKNLFVSCDMPFLTKEIVELITENSKDAQITIPEHEGKLEPLCAVYDRSSRAKFEELLRTGEWRLQGALKYFNVKKIIVAENVSGNQCFTNINTPDEFHQIKFEAHEYTN